MCENLKVPDLQKWMNYFSSTTTERRYQSILFKRDVIHLPSRRSSSSTTTSMRNIHLILPQKVAPVSSDGPDFLNKQDLLHVSSAFCNGDDLSPFVCKAFASSHPETLLYNLHSFTHSREFEIEEVCGAHYQDFILTIDDLRSLLSDMDSLKSSLSSSNCILQSVAGPLPRQH